MYALLYQPYWIINKLCFGQVGWRIFMLILLTYPYPQVSTQNFDYYYQHRAYRQSALPTYERINEPISLEPLVDDYTVDSGYKQTQLRLSQSSDGPVSLHGNGKDSNEYNVGNVDDAISSVRDLDTIVNSNDNQRRMSRSDETNQPGGAARTSFVKHNPSPSSQLKASSLNAEAYQPMMITHSSAFSSATVKNAESMENMFFVGSVMGITFVGIFIVFATGYFVHRINLQRKAAADVEYPAYGVVGPGAPIKEKEALSSVKTTSGSSKGSSSSAGGAAVCGAGSLSPSGDRRLAQSAQMYHYHHQKQQMISSEKVAEAGQHPSTSELDSDEEENEEGDYTVYECPGLASTGEMEVKNPLFQDDITPISSPSVSNTKPNGPSN